MLKGEVEVRSPGAGAVDAGAGKATRARRRPGRGRDAPREAGCRTGAMVHWCRLRSCRLGRA
eukprot:7900184-Alexandrium_andersonii.AAC.1